MKINLFAVLTLLPTLSFASTPIAQVSVKTDGNVVVATLGDDGNLSLDDAASNVRISSVRVRKPSLDLLSGLARRLATAPVVHTHHTYVCHVQVTGPQASLSVSTYDTKSGSYTGILREVYSYPGCGLADHTVPAKSQGLADARQLRAALEILVFENSPN